MGKATVDLPDPLEQPSSAGAANNADDLLAQLAGDEIDRLLAEAEVEQGNAAPVEEVADAEPAGSVISSQAPSSAPVEPSISKASEPEEDQILRDVLQAADATVQAGLAASSKEAVSPVADEVAAQGQLDGLFTELTKGPAAKAASVEPAPPIAPPVSISAKDLDQSLSAAAPAVLSKVDEDTATLARAGANTKINEKGLDFSDGQTSVEERSALDDDALPTSIDAITRQLDDLHASDAGDARLPLYLRPLEWLNAPFESMSPPVREALGKVALITLVNAVAVLLYVLIFR